MKKTSRALLFLYGGFLLWLLLFKGELSLSWLQDWSLESVKQGVGEGNHNLFFTIDNFLYAYLQGNLDPWFFWSNILGNILVFMPFGFLLKHSGYTMTRGLLYGLALILFIEGVQLVSGLGVFDVDDILLNGIGVFLGLLIYDILVGRRRN